MRPVLILLALLTALPVMAKGNHSTGHAASSGRSGHTSNTHATSSLSHARSTSSTSHGATMTGKTSHTSSAFVFH